MHFALLRENFTSQAASLWGDVLNLDRPADFDEAAADFAQGGFDGVFADYFNADGSYKGPCALGVSVEDCDAPADA